MSFGFFGIQIGWSLQMANMSAIYEYLGAQPDQIPMLWLAAPLTGLIIQPIIGNMSDRTWGQLGRRRPYFLIGAILSSLALVAMPNSSTLWMAAGLLWILDASINVSMEPFRAFVADKLPPSQVPQGFAMQSLLIGLGSVLASALPWILSNTGIASGTQGEGSAIPFNIRLSFYLGAFMFFAAVLWTVISTQEYPPEDMESFEREKQAHRGAGKMLRSIASAWVEMPATMRQLALVQFFTWLGLFCMWLYFPVAVAHHVFQAPDESSPLFRQGIEWSGVCFAAYSLVCFFFSIALSRLSKAYSLQKLHFACLTAGAAGLISVALIHQPSLLLISMVGVGIAWASILSMPYAILAGSIPADRMGLYMGIFNFFIVLPEILSALGLGWIMRNVLGNDRLSAVILGGVFLFIAGLLSLRVKAHLEASQSDS